VLYSSKLDFELDLRYGLSQLKAQVGLAAAIADGLTNDTVRNLCCPHPCGEYEKGKEKEVRKEGKDSAQRDKPLYRSGRISLSLLSLSVQSNYRQNVLYSETRAMRTNPQLSSRRSQLYIARCSRLTLAARLIKSALIAM